MCGVGGGGGGEVCVTVISHCARANVFTAAAAAPAVVLSIFRCINGNRFVTVKNSHVAVGGVLFE